MILQIDTEIVEKGYFWMETSYILNMLVYYKMLFNMKEGKLDKSYPHFLK